MLHTMYLPTEAAEVQLSAQRDVLSSRGAKVGLGCSYPVVNAPSNIHCVQLCTQLAPGDVAFKDI